MITKLEYPVVAGKVTTDSSGMEYIAATCPHCHRLHRTARSPRDKQNDGRIYTQCHDASPDWDAGSYFVTLGGRNDR